MTALAIAKMELNAVTSSLEGRNEPVVSFPPFRLDLAEERLWKGERELRLRRTPFAILRYLAQNPRRLITHSELTEAVWGKIAMSESLLRTHVRDLRRVIGKEVIETIVGRGYRLIANTIHVEDASSGRLPLSSPCHARVLKQVADVLDAFGTTAIVVVIVAEGHSSP